MALMLKGARLIDPQVGLDEVADILIRDGRIVEIGHDLVMEKGVERDLSGKVIVPGLVDMHVHLREPGFEQKEDIASGTRAAAHGGFTAVCAMPNTSPVIDNALGVEYVKARAAAVGKCRVIVAGACSKGLDGDTLADMGDMRAHGAQAFTDDGRGIQDAGMMRRVMDYAKQFDVPVMVHCQDDALVGEGQVNEGWPPPAWGCSAGRPRARRSRSPATSRLPVSPAARCTSSTSPPPAGLTWCAPRRPRACPSPAR